MFALRQVATVVSLGAFVAGATLPQSANAQFAARGITLLSHLDLPDFTAPAPNRGNSCWGYTSPSGREYAIMGLNDRAAFVEITDPVNPLIVEEIFHSSHSTADIKVYQRYAYVSTEGGGGVQVIDMQDIDAGVVTLVGSITANGLTRCHTLAVNEQSGFLYVCGGNVAGSNGGITAFSLANPAAPTFAGFWNGHYTHESQVVSYTSGPYAGREIAFCCDGEAGLHIVDVTNKAAMFLVSTLTYPGVSYCHQAWLSEDRNFIYINDELDGPGQGVPYTLTRIGNVSNLTAPTLAGTFTSNASTSTDHNLYVRGRFIYEANDRSGLRVFDALNPTAPIEVAYIDTYPENDLFPFDGAWSNYPFFPSGTIIISDRNRGLFIVRLEPDLLTISYPNGFPTQVLPNNVTPLVVEIRSTGNPPPPNSVMLHARVNGGVFSAVSMASIGGDQYQASLPAAACDSLIEFYVSALNPAGLSFTEPGDAPTSLHAARAMAGAVTGLTFDMETAAGWSAGAAGDTATLGLWERGDPEPTNFQPGDDHTGPPGVNCWVTGRLAGSFDVDGGRTTLLSPVFSLAGADPTTRIGYWRWYFNSVGGSPNMDVFTVDISNDGGTSWTNFEVVGPAGPETSGGWLFHDARVMDIMPPTATMRMRFIAEDAGAGSLIEAAIDDFAVTTIDCGFCPADFNQNGVVSTQDIFDFLAAFFTPGSLAADFNNSGAVTPQDIFDFLAAFFTPCS